MDVTQLLTVDDLVQIERIASIVNPTGRSKASINPALRQRIGERDGWICHICSLPVDSTKQWIKPQKIDPDLIAQARRLRCAPVRELAAWVGSDIDRARAVLDARRAGSQSWILPPRLTSQLHALEQRYVTRNAEVATVEHLVPVSFGGGDEEANLAIAHSSCNIARQGTNRDLILVGTDASTLRKCLRQLSDGTMGADIHHRRLHMLLRSALGICDWLAAHRGQSGVPTGLPERLSAALHAVSEVQREQSTRIWEEESRARSQLAPLRAKVDYCQQCCEEQQEQCARVEAKLESLVRPDAVARWRRRLVSERAKLNRRRRQLRQAWAEMDAASERQPLARSVVATSWNNGLPAANDLDAEGQASVLLLPNGDI